eukprot:CAMPEP_0184387734 /NCGR_PEP_ID=MMETSP0007-20130409/11009_1 /TAXON_ID=97485 /ORGANISM="Prymnesium parvum, Strain Texoma1" /LENGTH=83 /DNA_ID=CAMNT_0026736275 /DNA_START=304 /DNA_END=552 /DNA_ORIENTATION=-
MHEAAVDLLQPFDLVLQQNPHVMRLAQRRLFGHDDLNLHEELGPEVVRPHHVERGGRVVRLGHLSDNITEGGVGRFADDRLQL